MVEAAKIQTPPRPTRMESRSDRQKMVTAGLPRSDDDRIGMPNMPRSTAGIKSGMPEKFFDWERAKKRKAAKAVTASSSGSFWPWSGGGRP